MLVGRSQEQARLAALVEAARDGTGGALVLRGDPGIGKTALLDWVATVPAAGATVLRAAGAEFEADLPFAALSQLLRPVLHRLDALPAPQRAALAGAFGLGPPQQGDRLLVGLAVLSLLADGEPVVCLVDDAQWLDSVSADALLFAARRLGAECIAIVFAARDGSFPAPGVPSLELEGLADADAVRLLGAGTPPAVQAQQTALARGNPLALLTGGAPPEAFRAQVAALPPPTRAALLLAAADDSGELGPVLRLASAEDLRPAEEARLIEAGDGRIRFRHPLVRAAVYNGASLAERVAAHRALADALSGPRSADRHAWHRAAAATGPDDEVAALLEASAGAARARGGYGAAAAAYERAAELSTDARAQARRLLLAAENGLHAGAHSAAVRLAERAGGLDPDPAFLGRVGLVEGVAWFWQGNFRAAYDLMAYGGNHRAALHPAWYLGEPTIGECLDRLAASDDDPVARYIVAAARDRPLPPVADRRTAHDPAVAPRDLVELCGFGFVAGQDTETHELTAALVTRSRADGLAGLLPTLLFYLAEAELFAGRHRDAAVSVHEGLELARDTGQALWVGQLSAVAAVLHALAGDDDACRAAAADALAAAAPGAEPAGHPWTQWALGLLDLGRGRPEAAVPRLLPLQSQRYGHQVVAYRSIPDLVEAAVRAGQDPLAAPAVARLAAFAERTGRPWAQSLLHRCRALLSGDEQEFRLALKLPARPFERARTELLYGEWLRRARRRTDARTLLQPALETFDRLAARPWSARARTELEATGLPSAPGRPEPAPARLTPQELQIARLAAQGLSNKDIAAQLFLSPKTVAYHLYKAYPKLGVTARTDLAALPL
ncbi:helix-turn-helix domain-containing protein [Dactylosporangium vinaceum]|uniref:AAA family ATPase n=1 Tax=Dactylosporangium vinaceum TaxID=53362 RepID=A0ABV5M499_9ACTN|nr:LuxR family transcriptional regulator [Dactylosporangium vinaceum]UAB93415.1 helix-turn-helix domain-containing protein [Dactylosporangium vinaceum]